MNLQSGFKIISGGQSGVDRAALDVAIELGIVHGGWCPKGRLAEDGSISKKYLLQETETRNYSKRTIMNIYDSSSTLIITRDKPTGGTLLTKNIAEKSKKPLLIIELKVYVTKKKVARIQNWIAENNIKILNVAGPRESGTPGIYKIAKRLLTRVFS